MCMHACVYFIRSHTGLSHILGIEEYPELNPTQLPIAVLVIRVIHQTVIRVSWNDGIYIHLHACIYLSLFMYN